MFLCTIFYSFGFKTVMGFVLMIFGTDESDFPCFYWEISVELWRHYESNSFYFQYA